MKIESSFFGTNIPQPPSYPVWIPPTWCTVSTWISTAILAVLLVGHLGFPLCALFCSVLFYPREHQTLTMYVVADDHEFLIFLPPPLMGICGWGLGSLIK